MANISKEEQDLVKGFTTTYNSLLEEKKNAQKEYASAKKKLEDSYKESIADLDSEIKKRKTIIELLEGKKERKKRLTKEEKAKLVANTTS